MAIRHTFRKEGKIATIRAWKIDKHGERVPVFQNVPLWRQTTWDTDKYAPEWLRPDVDETMEGRGTFEKVVNKMFSMMPKMSPRTW